MYLMGCIWILGDSDQGDSLSLWNTYTFTDLYARIINEKVVVNLNKSKEDMGEGLEEGKEGWESVIML